jgi:hypothetical protein
MTKWIPGMFYDVGGAAALFWPDQHPEHPDPALAQRWIVFDPWGGLEIITGRPPREDAPIEREMGLAPFLTPPDPEEAARALWAAIRNTPVEAALRELSEEVWYALEDRKTLADPEVQRGIEAWRQGEVTEA